MERYPYVIVGGGMAADAAISGIRRRDKSGPIMVISDEPFPPYQRPPLSKKLWLDMRLEEVWLSGWQRQPHVSLRLGEAVSAVDAVAHTVTMASGRTLGYEKLLLATGGQPRTLGEGFDRVFYPGNMVEHIRLWQRLREPSQVLVVGGGFIGSEMTAVLSSQGHQVTWLTLESEPFEGFFPRRLRERVLEEYRAHGVVIHGRQEVTGFEETGDGIVAVTARGERFQAAAAVLGLGFLANDGLARPLGLTSDQGVVVDPYLATRDAHIWAAGDVAVLGPDGRRMMHEDHAVTQGRIAGENMAGAKKAYQHVPFYYSDLYQFGYEAIGNCSTALEVVEDWVTPGDEGVVYYLKEGVVAGVLNWNVWDGIGKARELIASGTKWEKDALMGRIRNAD